MNDNHEIMMTPYYRVMQALSLIKGPAVDDWVGDQMNDLVNKVTRQNNPIGRDQEELWTAFETAFDSAFTDTTKQQQALAAIQQLVMKGDDLDTYIATFKHLAREAGYELTAAGTVNMFALGLKPAIMSACMSREIQPLTMAEWETAARRELKNTARFQSMKNPTWMRYQWTNPKSNGYKPAHDADNRPYMPMDVDPPVFTRIRRVSNEQEKKHHQKEGRCFFCHEQGHMARDCPKKKRQFGFGQPPAAFGQPPAAFGQYHYQKPFKPNPQFKKKTFNQPKNTQGFRKSQRFKHHPKARVAYIDDIEEEEEEEEESVPSLAARTARLSEEQREQWVQEMKDMGINF